MKMTSSTVEGRGTPWLFFMFHLPAPGATARMSVWRKLQKYGALAWKNSAYALPHTPANLEKFQWLAAEIRKYRGDASIVEVARIEGHPDREIVALFNQARARGYEELIRDLRLALRQTAGRSKAQQIAHFARLNRRWTEIAATDVFGCDRRKAAEALLKELEARSRSDAATAGSGRRNNTAAEYRGRVWMTRPRPEVDRVGSAWLIRHFIDSRARFVFSADAEARPGAVRFDMFEGEFTHVGDDCTFETLLKRFKLRDKRLREIAQIIHDADLDDGKFGRGEGKAIDLITKGWAKMDWNDEEILRRGFELFDALYLTLGA
jgi:hypothetical protein